METLIFVCLCFTAVLAAPWTDQDHDQLEQQTRRRLQSLSVKFMDDGDDKKDRDDWRDDRDREDRRRDREYRYRDVTYKEGRDRDEKGRVKEKGDYYGKHDRYDRYDRYDRRDHKREYSRDEKRDNQDGRDREDRENSENREYRDREDRDREDQDREDRYTEDERRYDDRRDDGEDDDKNDDETIEERDDDDDNDDDETDSDEQPALRSAHLDALARQMDLIAMKYGSQGRVKVAYIPPAQKSSRLYHDLGSLNFRYISSRNTGEVQYQPSILNRPVLYIPRPDDAVSYNKYLNVPLRKPTYQVSNEDADDDTGH